MNYTKLINFNGTPCVEFSASGYYALLAYEIGSNVIRLRDNKNSIEIVRFKDSNAAKDIMASPEIWGLPTLYLPNRFADGILKTSDAIYQLPINEQPPFSNHIHGFLHKRKHQLVEHTSDESSATVKTQYLYDEHDEFFQYLPIKFLVEFTFTLSELGMNYNIKFTNLSEKMLPMSLATHTTINAPFVDESKAGDIRLTVPIGKKCELNERCLPTERILNLTAWDTEYKEGNKCPVLQDISNDMYFAEHTELDGEPFYGVIALDSASGKKICYEVSEEYKFWIIWNDRGFNGYFCPEPMTAMIDAPNLELPAETTGYVEIAPNGVYSASQRFFTK